MSERKISGTHLFIAIAVVAVSVFVGWEYLKSVVVNSTARYTVGVVTEFKESSRQHNNSIEYTYTVNGKQYNNKYRSRELTADIKGKRIVIKYSNTFRSWNYPYYTNIVPDSVHPPAEGWNEFPELN